MAPHLHAFAMAAAMAMAAARPPSEADPVSVDVKVASDFSYAVVIDGVTWLKSSAVCCTTKPSRFLAHHLACVHAR